MALAGILIITAFERYDPDFCLGFSLYQCNTLSASEDLAQAKSFLIIKTNEQPQRREDCKGNNHRAFCVSFVSFAPLRLHVFVIG